jgi:quinolinate synthase
MKKTGREMLLWDGSCIVHERFSEQELVKLKTRHPKAHVIAHPECPEALSDCRPAQQTFRAVVIGLGHARTRFAHAVGGV